MAQVLAPGLAPHGAADMLSTEVQVQEHGTRTSVQRWAKVEFERCF